MATLRELMMRHERQIVIDTLARHQGDRVLTAKALGVGRRTLDKLLERHHLAKRRYARVLPITKDLLKGVDDDSNPG